MTVLERGKSMLWIIALLCMGIFVYAFMFKPNRKMQTLHRYRTMEEMTIAVSEYFRERTYPQTRNLVSDEQALAENAEKNMLMDTMEKAASGSYQHRRIIIEEIMGFLMSTAFNITKLEDLSCISFINAKQMTPNEKFELMLFYTQKDLEEQMLEEGTLTEDSEGQFEAFYQLLNRFAVFSKQRQLLTAKEYSAYYITEKDLDDYFDVFMDERDEDITLSDAINLTAILIYQKRFGFGVLDTLVYQNIDEIQAGVGGTLIGENKHIASPLNSVITQINNKKVRLQFLRFESMKDLENTIVSLTENGEETFTPKDGFKYTTLSNMRRVTSRRPDVADSISVNIRKIASAGPTNVQLLKKNPVPIMGAEFVGEWLQLLAWAKMCVILSGVQGSGKTSHLNAFVELFGPDSGVRVLGNIDESRYMDRYPEFDIQHYFSTKNRSMHEVAAMMRRTNGQYMILTELLKSEDAQEAINNFTSGYLGGALSMHADTPEEAIQFIGQLLAMGQNTSTNDTQAMAAKVMSTFIGSSKLGDIFGFKGIYEILPRDYKPPFEEVDEDNPIDALARNNRLFQENTLNPEIFETRRLVGFDREINKYYPDQAPSPSYLAKIYEKLAPQHRDVFFGFMRKYYNLDARKILIDNGTIVLQREGA